MMAPSLRPERLPRTYGADAERTTNTSVAPYGPVTTALYGKQDMAAFFERGVALMDTPDPETRNFEADRLEHEQEMYSRWEQGK